MRIFLFIIFLSACSLVSAQSQKKYGIADEDNELPVGLKTGDKAPDFILFSDEGEEITLGKELQKGPVVLVFYRGIWCGHCTRYLSALQDSLEQIKNTGAEVLAITLEKQEYAAEMRKSISGGFPILIDSEEKVLTAYDVIFEVTGNYVTKVKVGKMMSIASNNESEDAKLPVPATYIIDGNGIIQYVHFDYNYKNRASVKKILQVLEPS